MRESFACACTVTGGKLKVFSREALVQALREFPDGLNLELLIHEPERKRSNAQNRFFYGPVCDAFKDLGYHKQETHDLLCLRFLPKPLKMPDGFVITVPGHTANLSVAEFNEFLEQVIQFAAEHDIQIQDSEQWLASHAEKD